MEKYYNNFSLNPNGKITNVVIFIDATNKSIPEIIKELEKYSPEVLCIAKVIFKHLAKYASTQICEAYNNLCKSNVAS